MNSGLRMRSARVSGEIAAKWGDAGLDDRRADLDGDAGLDRQADQCRVAVDAWWTKDAAACGSPSTRTSAGRCVRTRSSTARATASALRCV